MLIDYYYHYYVHVVDDYFVFVVDYLGYHQLNYVVHDNCIFLLVVDLFKNKIKRFSI